MSNPQDPLPINPIPPVVLVLALLMFAVEAVLWLGANGIVGGPQAVGWRIDLLDRFAIPGNLLAVMRDNGYFPADYLMRYLTYPFVHASFTHMIFAVVFTLALGKFVGEVFRAWAVLAVFFIAAIIGALAYGLLEVRQPLIGGYPAVFGFVGAFTYILWARLGAHGANRARAFLLIGMLLLFRVVFAGLAALIYGAASIGFDWVAELAGFATGFGLSFIISPGGWQQVLARLRQR